jgi:hypothetical protein
VLSAILREREVSDANDEREDRHRRELIARGLKAATEAMAGRNWDRAAKMFAACLELGPDNLKFRQSLRGCQRKKYKDNRIGDETAYLAIQRIRTTVEVARAAGDWIELDLAAEEGLALNPWDRQFNIDLGDANTELGRLEIARFAYDCARLGS